VRVDRPRLAVGKPVDGQAFGALPPLDGRHTAVEVRGDLLPGVQPRLAFDLGGSRPLGRQSLGYPAKECGSVAPVPVPRKEAPGTPKHPATGVALFGACRNRWTVRRFIALRGGECPTHLRLSWLLDGRHRRKGAVRP